MKVYTKVAFVHSKQNKILPVPNRYFGVYEDGTLKVRGIEARRHDTSEFFRKFQLEALEIMSEGNNIDEVKSLLPKVIDVYHKYEQLLKENRVTLDDLAFTKRLSKDSNKYQNRNTIESNALAMLNNEGKFLKAGETLQYLITDYLSKN